MAKAPKRKKRRGRRPFDGGRFRGPRVKNEDIDYKDVATLQRLTSAQGKLFGRKRTGLDAEGQRRIAVALKRARFMALMPFVS